ncbi:MAG: hypothetical protein ACI9MR_000684 [Myxococcota bacterium]|jgi:hypothetical protein
MWNLIASRLATLLCFGLILGSACFPSIPEEDEDTADTTDTAADTSDTINDTGDTEATDTAVTDTIDPNEPPALDQVLPAENTNAARPDADIIARFDRAVEEPPDAGFVVHSNLRGVIRGDLSDDTEKALTFEPIERFLPGEQITVSLVAGVIQSATLVAFPTSYVFEFRVATLKTASDPDFGAAEKLLTSRDTTHVVTADVSGDGLVDIIYTAGGALSYFINEGNGAFSAGGELATALPIVLDVAVGDLNGDNRPDFVISSPASALALVSDGGTTISYTAAAIDGGLGGAVALGDLDGDGDLDAVFAAGTPGVAINAGRGAFSTVDPIDDADGLDATSDVAIADIDNDGALDLIFAVNRSGDVAGVALVFRNSGDADFDVAEAYPIGMGAQAIVAADFDEDGNIDIAVSNGADGTVGTLANDGSGRFDAQVPITTGGVGPLLTADLDGDGLLDILGAGLGANPLVWLTNSATGFTTDMVAETAPRTNSIALADIDGDGDLDVIQADLGSSTLTIHHNIEEKD